MGGYLITPYYMCDILFCITNVQFNWGTCTGAAIWWLMLNLMWETTAMFILADNSFVSDMTCVVCFKTPISDLEHQF